MTTAVAGGSCLDNEVSKTGRKACTTFRIPAATDYWLLLVRRRLLLVRRRLLLIRRGLLLISGVTDRLTLDVTVVRLHHDLFEL